MSGKRPAAHRCCGVFIVLCQTESLKRLSNFAIRSGRMGEVCGLWAGGVVENRGGWEAEELGELGRAAPGEQSHPGPPGPIPMLDGVRRSHRSRQGVNGVLHCRRGFSRRSGERRGWEIWRKWFAAAVAFRVRRPSLLMTWSHCQGRFMPSTEELVEAARVGDVSAFSELVRRYEGTVTVTAWTIVRDFHRARDVAQESFVIAYQKLDRLRDSKVLLW